MRSDDAKLATPPNPGSDAAAQRGCTCPRMDNGRGSDVIGRERGFWITAGCPVHAAKQKGATVV